jgi:large subunit ribosomal protein L6
MVENDNGQKRIVARIGSMPIEVLKGVEVTVGAENAVTVKGPKGTLEQSFHPELGIIQADDIIKIERPSDEAGIRALQGLTRAVLNNMVLGVTEGFQKSLDLVGTGYRVQQTGQNITLLVGYSHPVDIEAPAGITLTVETPTHLLVDGCDKQQVGQIAAVIRAVRKPDAYKGKGIRYTGEVVRLKPGKSAARS